MLIDITFKRVADFHGHLCPDLVIGGKLCEYVQKLMQPHCLQFGALSIVAENCTSALDAIQTVLGFTIGNQRLRFMDYGKHNYTLICRSERHSRRLSLRPLTYGDEAQFDELEENMRRNQVALDEVIYFQKCLDDRVAFLLDRSPETLFEVSAVPPGVHLPEMPACYRICRACGEPVLQTHAITRDRECYCVPCLQHSAGGAAHHVLH